MIKIPYSKIVFGENLFLENGTSRAKNVAAGGEL